MIKIRVYQKERMDAQIDLKISLEKMRDLPTFFLKCGWLLIG